MISSMLRFFNRIVILAIVSAVFAGVLGGCAGAPARPVMIARGDYEAAKLYITQLIQYEMKKNDVVGLSIALVDDQKVVWAQGFGHADKAANIAASPETVYRTGSISKLFTDTAVMQLAEQGKLDIDQPLQTYLPSFSVKTRFVDAGPITPRNVMTHHSGLPDSLINGMWTERPESFTQVVNHLKDDYAAYPPNFILSYSNVGITLLGHMIQQVAGREYSVYMDDAVLKPMGMTHSRFSVGAEGPAMTKAYRAGIEATEWPLRDTPAGGLNSNVLDLSRFMQMVFAQGKSNGREILKPATLAEMLRSQNDGVALDLSARIGLGWMIGRGIKNAGIVAHHGGATMLHRSELKVLPEHKLGVVVLANSSSAGAVVNKVAVD